MSCTCSSTTLDLGADHRPDCPMRAQGFVLSPGVRLFGRGDQELLTLLTACSHELVDNDRKGHWLKDEVTGEPRTDQGLLADLLYHAAKLGFAMRANNPTAVLEYAADVANCAMFCADKHDALALELLHEGPIEYDDEQPRLAEARDYSEFKRITHDWAKSVLELPVPDPDAGFVIDPDGPSSIPDGAL